MPGSSRTRQAVGPLQTGDESLLPPSALSEKEEAERLRQAQELLRVFGDPRTRVEVPHSWGGDAIPLHSGNAGRPTRKES
jgi:hypothetical protein